MPRSHSVAVAALTTSIVFIVCVESPSFAVSLIFSIIVMFDSSGVRRQSGEHAILLNQLIKDVQYFADEIKDWKHKEKIEKREEIKEMQIGRASCREREWIARGDEQGKKNEEK